MMVAQRYLTEEVLQVEIYGRLGGNLTAKMKNLSSTGAQIEIFRGAITPRKGDVLKATVTLRQIGKIRIFNAEVIWSRGLEAGICFLKREDLVQKILSKATL